MTRGALVTMNNDLLKRDWVWDFIWIPRASLVAQMVKHLPAMQETRVQSLGWEDPLKKEMTAHFSILAWKIPWTAEPGRLQSTGSLRVSTGSLRVGHDWVTSLSLFTFMHWRRKWQPTPVLLPGKSHGQRSLVVYSPRGLKQLDTSEQLRFR